MATTRADMNAFLRGYAPPIARALFAAYLRAGVLGLAAIVWCVQDIDSIVFTRDRDRGKRRSVAMQHVAAELSTRNTFGVAAFIRMVGEKRVVDDVYDYPIMSRLAHGAGYTEDNAVKDGWISHFVKHHITPSVRDELRDEYGIDLRDTESKVRFVVLIAVLFSLLSSADWQKARAIRAAYATSRHQIRANVASTWRIIGTRLRVLQRGRRSPPGERQRTSAK